LPPISLHSRSWSRHFFQRPISSFSGHMSFPPPPPPGFFLFAPCFGIGFFPSLLLTPRPLLLPTPTVGPPFYLSPRFYPQPPPRPFCVPLPPQKTTPFHSMDSSLHPPLPRVFNPCRLFFFFLPTFTRGLVTNFTTSPKHVRPCFFSGRVTGQVLCQNSQTLFFRVFGSRPWVCFYRFAPMGVAPPLLALFPFTMC